MASAEIELYGRKTFFIAPDTSLIPKNYLEEFMFGGYQAYIINDDYACPMQSKVREIIRLFPESILFFNIDATIEGIEWKSYIRSIQEEAGENALVGIFYLARQNPQQEESIKNFYLNELKVKAGCFALSAHDHNNFESILKVLEQNNARGRRNHVRANCDSSSVASFAHKGHDYQADILDVNISYFRCDLHADSDQIEIFEKFRDVKFCINGADFTSDAVLIMKRTMSGKNLCVFMFIKHDDTPDLEKDAEKCLNQKIYQIVLNENMGKLQNAFRTAER